MAPKKIIVHIGSGKCGSTSLQHALIQNKDVLIQNGYTAFTHYDFPDIVKVAINGYADSALPFEKKYIDQYDNAIDSKQAAQEINSKLHSAQGIPILSSEYFFEINPVRRDQRLQFLSDILVGFDDITVVFYFRAPDDYVRSLYAQWFAPEFAVSFDKFINHFDFQGNKNAFYSLNMEKHLAAIQKIVKPQNVRFEALENLKDHKSILHNCMDLIGAGDIDFKVSKETSNKSLSAGDFAIFYAHKDNLNSQQKENFYHYLMHNSSNHKSHSYLLIDNELRQKIYDETSLSLQSIAPQTGLLTKNILEKMQGRLEQSSINLDQEKSAILTKYPLEKILKKQKSFGRIKKIIFFIDKVKKKLQVAA